MITLKYYGVEGTGRTITDAKKDAGAKIEQMLKGDYTPYLLRHGEYMALITREPHYGWGYRLIHPDTLGRMFTTSCGPGGFAECLSRAKYHVAQLVGHYDGLDLDPDERRSLDSYYTFQDVYAELMAIGATDEQAYRSACMYPRR